MSIIFSGNTYNFGATVAARLGTGTTSYVFSGLCAGSTYGFIIWAFNAGGTSSIVGPVIFLTSPVPAPEEFIVSQYGEQDVILNWTYESEENIDGFQIFRGNSPLIGLTFVDNETRDYIDQGLTKGITYTYEIQAVANGSSSPPLDSSKTLPILTTEVYPADPVGLTASINPSNASQVLLFWNKGTGFGDEPRGYQIFRSVTNDKYRIIASTTGATNYTDKRLTSGTTYYYKISAYNDGGPSSITGPVFIRVLGPKPTTPSGLTGQNIDENSVTLQWLDNSINENLFKIYYRT